MPRDEGSARMDALCLWQGDQAQRLLSLSPTAIDPLHPQRRSGAEAGQLCSATPEPDLHTIFMTFTPALIGFDC